MDRTGLKNYLDRAKVDVDNIYDKLKVYYENQSEQGLTMIDSYDITIILQILQYYSKSLSLIKEADCNLEAEIAGLRVEVAVKDEEIKDLKRQIARLNITKASYQKTMDALQDEHEMFSKSIEANDTMIANTLQVLVKSAEMHDELAQTLSNNIEAVATSMMMKGQVDDLPKIKANTKLPDNETLKMLYIDQNRTVSEIASLYGTTYQAVRKRLKAIDNLELRDERVKQK